MKILALVSLLVPTVAMATISVTGEQARGIWTALEIVSKTNNISLAVKSGETEIITLDTVSCVFENYYACSFFANKIDQRVFSVVTDGTEYLMNKLVTAGLQVHPTEPRLDATLINCQKTNEDTQCQLIEFVFSDPY